MGRRDSKGGPGTTRLPRGSSDNPTSGSSCRLSTHTCRRGPTEPGRSSLGGERSLDRCTDGWRDGSSDMKLRTGMVGGDIRSRLTDGEVASRSGNKVLRSRTDMGKRTHLYVKYTVVTCTVVFIPLTYRQNRRSSDVKGGRLRNLRRRP